MLNHILIIFMVGVLMLNSCAIAVPPEVKIKPTITYKYYDEKDGLKISIDPIFEENRVKEYFGTDLDSLGILPVLIVAENSSSKSSYLVTKKDISLNIKQHSNDLVKKSGSAGISKPGDHLYGIGGAFATGGLIVPILIIPGAIFTQIANKKAQDYKTITDNLTKKGFTDSTIFPHESHSGFIYFPIKENELGQNNLVINVKVINMTANKPVSFRFDVKKNGN
jgi:hypothetical protein